MMPTSSAELKPGDAYKSLYDIIARLRGPGGCPWDQEQNPSSLRGDLIEETYECIEAIDENDPDHIKEELGDIFLLVTFLAYIHEEADVFSVADALQTACDKLVRRHPHVFGETKVQNSAEVLSNWNKIKVEQEGRRPKDSVLDEVSSGLPPLDRAWKLQKKAAKAGFDWPDIEGVAGKIQEELAEVLEAAEKNADGTDAARNKTEEELGDLLFSAVNLCRYLKVEPSVALRRTNSKFIHRFKYMEKMMKETGQEMKRENLGLMDQHWNDAKTGAISGTDASK
jgi:tetrapyrrole methylase family protein/MazG family protein